MTRCSRWLSAALLLISSSLVNINGQEQGAVVVTIAGDGKNGSFSGDGGDPRYATISNVLQIRIDNEGNLLVPDSGNRRLRKITFGTSSIIETVAGGGAFNFLGDGGLPTSASVHPSAAVMDANGNIYIADGLRIRKITRGDVPTISTVAGTGEAGFSGDGGDPLYAQFNQTQGLAIDSKGDLYVSDSNRIRKVTFGEHSTIMTIAGGPGDSEPLGDGGDPLNARFWGPMGLAFDSKGNLYVADSRHNRIRKITFGNSPLIETVVGSGLADYGDGGGDPLKAALSLPNDIALDENDQLFIADSANNRVRMVTSGPNPKISTILGNGEFIYRGEGGDPRNAVVSFPQGISIDRDGNIYLSAVENRILKITGFATPATKTTLSATPTTARYGDTITLTITSKPNTSVTILDNGNPLSPAISVTTDENGNAITTITLPVGDHSLTARANTTSGPVGVAVSKARQVITFHESPPITFGNAPITLNATASSGLPVTFHVISGPCSISGLSTLTAVGAGICETFLSQDGNENYLAADTVHVGFGIAKASQTISFPPIPASHSLPRDAFPLSATASSGLTVAFSATGNCSVSGSTLTLASAGSCVVIANQAGNENYNAATLVSQTIQIVSPVNANITVYVASTQVTYPGATNFVVAVSGTPTATGNVDIFDGLSKIATATLQGDGKAYLYLSGFNVGQHQISASYPGDSNHAGGHSAPVTVNVSPVPVNFGVACWSAAPTTFQCTVNVSSNAGSATGLINYGLDGNAPLSGSLSNGNAQFLLTAGPGSHTLQIKYPAQGNFAASSVNTQNFTTK